MGFRTRQTGNMRGRAFLMLEVVLALGILGLSAAVLMRAYAQGVSTVQKTEAISVSVMLAEGLMDEFEIIPPEGRRARGGFGENYPEYRWEVEVVRETPRYRYQASGAKPDELNDLITYTVTIVFEPRAAHKPYVPLRFSYHPTLIEPFSEGAKFENQVFETLP